MVACMTISSGVKYLSDCLFGYFVVLLHLKDISNFYSLLDYIFLISICTLYSKTFVMSNAITSYILHGT